MSSSPSFFHPRADIYVGISLLSGIFSACSRCAITDRHPRSISPSRSASAPSAGRSVPAGSASCGDCEGLKNRIPGKCNPPSSVTFLTCDTLHFRSSAISSLDIPAFLRILTSSSLIFLLFGISFPFFRQIIPPHQGHPLLPAVRFLIFALDGGLDQTHIFLVIMYRFRSFPVMGQTELHFKSIFLRRFPPRRPRENMMFFQISVLSVISPQCHA